MAEATNATEGSELLYGIDDVPPPLETAVLGFQHYLTMFGSTVAIPLILSEPLGLADKPQELGYLIATMFFISGITTLMQTTWGNRLPIVQGGTFSFLAPAFARECNDRNHSFHWFYKVFSTTPQGCFFPAIVSPGLD